MFPEAPSELHLVGQSQGRDRAQRLRGGISRPRQHRRLRSQRAAADRRISGAGRRHGLDGPVLSDHARDRPGAHAGRRRPTPTWRSSSPSISSGSGGGASALVGMWDEEDGFFYDVLRKPNGESTRLKVRSLVGLLPICAATVFEPGTQERLPVLNRRLERFLAARPELIEQMHDPFKVGVGGRRLGAIVNETRLRRVLARMLDEREFLSPHGIRSVSRYHAEHPYVYFAGGQAYGVNYEPAESHSGMFGGNSNWRGPIWMPINGLIIRALLNYYAYYGDAFQVECPTGSGVRMNLFQVAKELTRRLESIFRRGARRSSSRLRRQSKVSSGPVLARLPPLLRILPRRQRCGPRREPSDGLDRYHRAAHSDLRDNHARESPRAGRGRSRRGRGRPP